VTDTRESVQEKSRLGRLFAGRWLFLITILVGIGSYVVGLNVGYLDIAGARQFIQQLRADNQKLKTQIADLNMTQVALQNKLSTFEAALDEIIPAKNTYNVKPNQSMIVASGRLTVSDWSSLQRRVNISNVEKQRRAGRVIKVTSIRRRYVRFGSNFDMFRAVLNASCTQAQ
jgi:cell division protein FtsB